MVTVARSQGARWRRWGQVALAAYWSATGLSDLVSSSRTGPDGWVRLLFGLAWAVLAVLSWRERVELSAGGVRVVGSFRSRSASWDEVSGVRRHQDWQDVLVLRLSDGRELEVPRHGPELEAELRGRLADAGTPV